MKVFVSTRRGQGIRKSDFCFTRDEEMLTFTTECCRDTCDIDGECGCRRCMTGFWTRKGTTTFMVMDYDMTMDTYIMKVRETAKLSGWYKIYGDEGEKIILNEAKELLRLANIFPVGVVLEKRGDTIQARDGIIE